MNLGLEHGGALPTRERRRRASKQRFHSSSCTTVFSVWLRHRARNVRVCSTGRYFQSTRREITDLNVIANKMPSTQDATRYMLGESISRQSSLSKE